MVLSPLHNAIMAPRVHMCSWAAVLLLGDEPTFLGSPSLAHVCGVGPFLFGDHVFLHGLPDPFISVFTPTVLVGFGLKTYYKVYLPVGWPKKGHGFQKITPIPYYAIYPIKEKKYLIILSS